MSDHGAVLEREVDDPRLSFKRGAVYLIEQQVTLSVAKESLQKVAIKYLS